MTAVDADFTARKLSGAEENKPNSKNDQQFREVNIAQHLFYSFARRHAAA